MSFSLFFCYILRYSKNFARSDLKTNKLRCTEGVEGEPWYRKGTLYMIFWHILCVGLVNINNSLNFVSLYYWLLLKSALNNSILFLFGSIRLNTVVLECRVLNAFVALFLSSEMQSHGPTDSGIERATSHKHLSFLLAEFSRYFKI